MRLPSGSRSVPLTPLKNSPTLICPLPSTSSASNSAFMSGFDPSSASFLPMSCASVSARLNSPRLMVPEPSRSMVSNTFCNRYSSQSVSSPTLAPPSRSAGASASSSSNSFSSSSTVLVVRSLARLAARESPPAAARRFAAASRRRRALLGRANMAACRGLGSSTVRRPLANMRSFSSRSRCASVPLMVRTSRSSSRSHDDSGASNSPVALPLALRPVALPPPAPLRAARRRARSAGSCLRFACSRSSSVTTCRSSTCSEGSE
mmetsp:Transcript_2261/g.7534  ORF Transcript_2261/g.7534 Transcript_2261/m.7534 type:complete len:263 (+) Transcript_2261:618-1406(+)